MYVRRSFPAAITLTNADHFEIKVDLQINYLWQLENRDISDDFSFSESEPVARKASTDSQATRDDGRCIKDDSENAEFKAIPETSTSITSLVGQALSDPASTPLGPVALGPELFVKSVIKHYTEWLEREIINGPIGKERRRREDEARLKGTNPPTPKILVAAALPPMVPDDALWRITEKYGQRQLPTVCRAPTPPTSPYQDASPAKLQSIDELLRRLPSVCNLATRVRMTNEFNAQLREFCVRHSNIFVFVDVGPAMRASSPDYHSACGEVDRAMWADRLDKTNVHPLWEPTISLWQKELAKEAAVPGCLNWVLKEDPKETLNKYEDRKQGVLDRVSERGYFDATKRNP